LVRSDGRLDLEKMWWREEDVFAIHFGGIVVRMCGGIGYGVGDVSNSTARSWREWRLPF